MGGFHDRLCPEYIQGGDGSRDLKIRAGRFSAISFIVVEGTHAYGIGFTVYPMEPFLMEGAHMLLEAGIFFTNQHLHT